MEPLRRVIERVREHLGKLTVSQRLLIGSLAVIAAMSLFLVAQYAGSGRMVELLGSASAADQQQAARVLQTAGVSAELRDGRLMVPPAQRAGALAALAQEGALPADTTILFRNMLEKQGLHLSRQQNEQLYLIALQNELARVIRGFNAVRDATVLLDVPEPTGFGRSVRQPTASATVFTRTGQPLDQGTVDAIAELIAGARSGLDVTRVRVIDGSVGRQRRPTDKNDVLPTTYLEHAARVEDQVRTKIDELLAHVPGRTIAVTAQVDVTRVNSQTIKYLESERGTVTAPLRERSSSIEQGGASRGAEPGVRSNTRADISRSGSTASTSTQTDDETEFDTRFGTQTTSLSDPRGMPTRLAASINIPRSYVAALVKRGRAADATDEPTEEEIAGRFAQEREAIVRSVEPHVTAASPDGVTPGEVVVTMIPIDLALPETQTAGFLGGLATGGGGGPSIGPIVEKALLVALAVAALGFMLMLVRRSGKPQPMPNAEELAGIPPKLITDTEIIGEADESDTAMTGIELNDDAVRTKKVLEKVEEMLANDPATAANLLQRWIHVET